MKIVVVGLGYVGLSNAVLLSQHNEVIGVDISQERVDTLRALKSPIIDTELSEYLSKKDLNFSASTNLTVSIVGADYVIVSTPTNYDERTNFFDTSTVEAVIATVIKIEPKACIIVKSTIPVGFIEDVRVRLSTDAVIFSPEFLREGKALYDNLYPSRIVVGEKSLRAEKFANLLANGALKKNIEILCTNAREAEAIKLFSNTYLAMRVAFFNELDSYALAGGMESREIIDGVALDPRIGNYYNNPSFGYGGYCLPKDTKQLLANYHNIPQNIIGAVVEANNTRKDFLAKIIIKEKPQTIGIYRLLMKEGSDNIRNSAIFDIVEKIKKGNIKIVIYEPLVTTRYFADLYVESDLNQFKKISDVILANRLDSEISDVLEKVFTRDVYTDLN